MFFILLVKRYYHSPHENACRHSCYLFFCYIVGLVVSFALCYFVTNGYKNDSEASMFVMDSIAEFGYADMLVMLFGWVQIC